MDARWKIGITPIEIACPLHHEWLCPATFKPLNLRTAIEAGHLQCLLSRFQLTVRRCFLGHRDSHTQILRTEAHTAVGSGKTSEAQRQDTASDGRAGFSFHRIRKPVADTGH